MYQPEIRTLECDRRVFIVVIRCSHVDSVQSRRVSCLLGRYHTDTRRVAVSRYVDALTNRIKKTLVGSRAEELSTSGFLYHAVSPLLPLSLARTLHDSGAGLFRRRRTANHFSVRNKYFQLLRLQFAIPAIQEHLSCRLARFGCTPHLKIRNTFVPIHNARLPSNKTSRNHMRILRRYIS